MMIMEKEVQESTSMRKFTPVTFFKLAETFLDAVLDRAFNRPWEKVSASRSALLKLSLKKSFAASSVYDRLLQQKQFVFFGDTNHTDRSLHAFVYSRENIDKLRDAGIKHFFPEVEPRYQSRVNDVAEGQISPDRFMHLFAIDAAEQTGKSSEEYLADSAWKNNIVAWGQGLRDMHDDGIEIHCLDDRSHIDEKAVQDLLLFMGEMKSFTKAHGLPGLFHGKLLIHFVLDNMEKIKNHELELKNVKSIFAPRNADDPELAERIKKAAGEERGAILFGAGHGFSKERSNSLADCLGRNQVTQINLYSNRPLYADRLSESSRLTPDYAYIVQENKIFSIYGRPTIV